MFYDLKLECLYKPTQPFPQKTIPVNQKIVTHEKFGQKK